MDISKERLDPNLYQEGAWVPYDESGTRVLLACFGNPRHQAALNRAMSALYQDALRRGLDQGLEDEALRAFANEEARRDLPIVERESMADGVILGWEGIVDDGDPVEFSRDTALDLIRTIPTFAVFCMSESQLRANFRAIEDDNAGKD